MKRPEWINIAGGQSSDWRGYHMTATTHGYTVQTPDGRVISGAARGAYGRAAYNSEFLLSRNRDAAELCVYQLIGAYNER